MEKVSTADRLRQIMEERDYKQVDILRLCTPLCVEYDVKMNKSDISQYVSGKVEPSQEKLVILGMALNVTESWLMGFNTSPQRKDAPAHADKDIDFLYRYSKLNERDRKVVSDLIDSMLSSEESGAN